MNQQQSPIDALTQAHLIAPLRRLLHSETVEVIDWQAEALTPGLGNPSSLGVYKVHGRVRHQGRARTFEMALKMSQSPARIGLPQLGADSAGPDHWNYWRREQHISQSEWAQTSTHPLGMPRFYAVHEQSSEELWLWTEFIDAPPETSWSLDDFCFVAHEFGRFNGAHVNNPALEAIDWLARNPPLIMGEQILEVLPFVHEAGASARYWSHPQIASLLPDSSFIDPLKKRQDLIRMLARVPMTLSHNDAYPTNIKLLRDDDGGRRCIGLDWAMLGLAPLGSELMQLILGGIQTRTELKPEAIDQAMFTAYLNGLRAAGWQGDEAMVRLGFLGTVMLRNGAFTMWLGLGAGMRMIQSADLDEALAQIPPEAIQFAKPMASYVMRYNEELRALLGHLDA